MNMNRTAFAGGIFVVSLLLVVLGGALGGFFGGAFWCVGLVLNFLTLTGAPGVFDSYNFRGDAFGVFLVVVAVLGLISGLVLLGWTWWVLGYAVGVSAGYMLFGATKLNR